MLTNKKAKGDQSKYSDYIDTSYRESSIMERIVYRFKVILLGDIAVGKSSILSRFVEDKYTNEYRCNVGVEFKVKSLFLDDKRGADLQIWDTVGEERFRTITRQYYRDSKGKFLLNKKLTGVILIFDLTNRTSFDNLEKWIEDVLSFGPEGVKFLLIGNKSDLDDDRVVSYIEAVNLAKRFDTNYIEVSAKTGNNVASVFEELTKLMVSKEEEDNEKRKKKKGKIEKSHYSVKQSIMLEKATTKPQSTGCCKK
jgi:small GTP-binding protein